MMEMDFRSPGQLIQHLLDERQWSQRVLAVVLSMSESAINKIILGSRSVDAELALALGSIFGVPPERFLALQQSLDLAQAQLFTRTDPSLARRATVFGALPIAEMIKRGWLAVPDIKDFAKIEDELKRFFGVTSFDEIEAFPHAAKKTRASKEASPVQIAWLYRVNKIASEMLAPQFTPESGRTLVKKLKPLLGSTSELRQVPRLLTESGIRFLIVESLPSAKIDGVCFWLDDSNPVVAMSLRFDRIDNFWFVLRHELEHVLQRHGLSGPMLDTELEGNKAGVGNEVAEEERIANEAASEFCVPKKMLDAFISRKAPLMSERDMLAFAKMLQVHPGIVAGQLRHKTNRYDLFQDHLAKVRSVVSPGAIVDGWGDIISVD